MGHFVKSFITKRGNNILRRRTLHGGAILLHKGGSGVGSFYTSQESRDEILGTGLKHLVSLQNLELKLPTMTGSKPKNIRFN